MKLWQLNVKMRRLLDRIGWPLVTRARYTLLKENLEAELDHAEQVNNTLRQTLLQVREDIAKANAEAADLRVKLHVAEKNDHRNPETGRFEKAPE